MSMIASWYNVSNGVSVAPIGSALCWGVVLAIEGSPMLIECVQCHKRS